MPTHERTEPVGSTRPERRAGHVLSWRPSLRLGVGVVALLIVTGMAVLTAWLAADRLRAVALTGALHSAQAVVSTYLDPELSPATLAEDGARNPAINAQLERLVAGGDMLRIIVWSPAGQVAYASDAMLRGHQEEMDADLQEALDGESAVDYGDKALASAEMESLPVLEPPFLELYIPIYGPNGSDVIGAYEMYQDAAPIEAHVNETRNGVLAIAFGAAALLFITLWLSFAGASRLLARQNRLLRERSVRDPLTGLHNHGHLLDRLGRSLEALAPSGRRSAGAVAIIDIDSFHLLNTGHGHRAGDEVIQAVASVLTAVVAPGQVFGRFGPDEFLVADFDAGADPGASRLLHTVEALRLALSEVDFKFGGSEPLPVTVSVGVAQAPRDGTRPLELLSLAEAALREAKTGGGSVTRVADQATIGSLAAQDSVFGVLEGLVATVDAKDHYTRYHSEHVTSLALFLARELKLPEDDQRRLRLAGLLHDVGKVGIPDAILRKPGPLTDAEYTAVKQHVALGDAIVGAVPQLAEVRASVRHHHERWDGSGYLDGLSGDKIPLLARILAVADAYSAMTTTRPYRKALTPDQALARVAQAAGTQLDPDLAMRFVSSMRRHLAEERGTQAETNSFQPRAIAPG